MTTDTAVFLDANALVYALDKTSELHSRTVSVIQCLLDEGAILCTSHHVIEEVLRIGQKLAPSSHSLPEIVREIGRIPDLVLIKPAANLDFAKRYAALSQKMKLGVNDALILQLMLDAGITRLSSYDKQLVKQAKLLSFEQLA